MDILNGLNGKQIGALRHIRQYVRYQPGEMIFKELSPAEGLYVIVKGTVQIFRDTTDGQIEVARLGAGDVFGEMGILSGSGTRTASACAVDDVLVMIFPSNPLEMFQDIGDSESALAVLKNLVAVLAERLRAKDQPGWVPLNLYSVPTWSWNSPGSEGPLAVIQKSVPHGLLRRIMGEKKLESGDCLCRQGDKSDGFYIIHEGELQVDQTAEDGSNRILATINGPTIAGEIGFFTDQPRATTLKAISEVRYEYFSGSEFRKLASKEPARAFDVLFAVAQLAVCLILHRENG